MLRQLSLLLVAIDVCLSFAVTTPKQRNNTILRRFRAEDCTEQQILNLDSTFNILHTKLHWTITSIRNEDRHEINDRMFSMIFQASSRAYRTYVATRYQMVLNEIVDPERGEVDFLCDNPQEMCGAWPHDTDGPYTRRWAPPGVLNDPESTVQRGRPWIAFVCLLPSCDQFL